MRYVTATLGAVFIFVAVFILSALLTPFLPPFLRTPVNLGIIVTNNILGAILALAAAAASFRATIRHGQTDKSPKE